MEIDKFTIIVRDFNILLSETGRFKGAGRGGTI